MNTKVSEVENKNHVNSKCVTTKEFEKLTAENFESRLKQADLLNKMDFDNKLLSY